MQAYVDHTLLQPLHGVSDKLYSEIFVTQAMMERELDILCWAQADPEPNNSVGPSIILSKNGSSHGEPNKHCLARCSCEALHCPDMMFSIKSHSA